MDKLTAGWNNFSKQINSSEISTKISRSFLQAKQFAAERVLGTADEITELPTEYRALEERVDRVKLVYESFLRVTQTFTKPQNDYSMPVQDSVVDFGRKLGDRMSEIAQTVGEATKLTNPGSGSAAHVKSDAPPATLGHALAKASRESAELVGLDEPLGAALKRFSQAMTIVGDQKLRMDAEIVQKFHDPILNAFTSNIAAADKARRRVEASRLTYDGFKHSLKGASSPTSTSSLRQDLEKAEDEFVKSVEDAMGQMKAVVDDPLPLKALSDFIRAFVAYHKAAYESLSELAPEIDELNATNDTLLGGH